MNKSQFCLSSVIVGILCVSVLQCSIIIDNSNKMPKSSITHGDLVIDDIVNIDPLLINQFVDINVTVKHISGAYISTNFYVELIIDSISQENISVTQDLSLGQTYNVIFEDINLTSSGLHSINAIVDKDNLVTEGNDANNERTENWDWFLALPDLVIDTITPINNLYTHNNVNINVTVKNIGYMMVTATYIVELTIDSISIQNVSVTTDLAINDKVAVIFNNINQTNVGSHSIFTFVDKDDLITEFNETNNNATANWNWVFNPSLKPDLIMNSLFISSPTTVNTTITFTISIKNIGSWTTATGSQVEILENGISKWNQTIPILIVNGIFVFNHTVNSTTAINITLTLKVDILEQIAELDETNNLNTTSLSITDLSTNNPPNNPDPPTDDPEPLNETLMIILGGAVVLGVALGIVWQVGLRKMPSYRHFHKWDFSGRFGNGNWRKHLR